MSEEKKSKFEDYFTKNHKKLMLVPLLILVFSILVLSINFASSGEIVKRSVELRGGATATITKTDLDFNQIESHLRDSYEDITIRKIKTPSSNIVEGLTIEVGGTTESELKATLDEININSENLEEGVELTIGDTSSEFSEGFYKSLIKVILIAFVLMSLAVFIAFRSIIPSIAVISSVIIDLLFTLAMVSLLNINLSAGGIVAFLLVIGYSLDTDIVLTNSFLKKKSLSLYSRYREAMTTGLTMTVTTLVALTAAYFVSSNEIWQQMFLIIIFALIADVFVTYLFNAPILWMHVSKKK